MTNEKHECPYYNKDACGMCFAHAVHAPKHINRWMNECERYSSEYYKEHPEYLTQSTEDYCLEAIDYKR